jgi:hypothetical protein
MQHAHHQLPNADLVHIVHPGKRKEHSRLFMEVQRGTGGLSQAAIARDVISVQVGVDDVSNAVAALVGQL